ncbi:hypothetical protein N0V90_001967 [Kalmusia sp. IMI 367209]|nr:hypothetical protein N0V90_001967 [Kalmusia sp. IMI 367209]
MGEGTKPRVTPIPLHIDMDKSLGLPSPQTREPSYDGTVTLPTPTSKPGTLIRYQPPDSFPIFKSGDVIIKTDLGPSPTTFQLHSPVLCQHSHYFANAILNYPSDEQRPSWYSFTIEEADGKVRLVRQQSNGDCPNISHNGLQMIEGTEIKPEDVSDDNSVITPSSSSSTDPTLVNRKPKYTTAIACYTQMLASFYTIAPQISTTGIGTALVQSEKLVKIATELGCVHLLQAHLGNIYAQYRKKLFLAIKSDPPRWMQLAIALENKTIYTECLIHMVGAHPKWPWTTSRKGLAESTQHLIRQKASELDRLRVEVERDILLINLNIGGGYGHLGHAPDPTQRTEIETWMTVQVFRDEIAKRISAVERHKDHSLLWGTLYRKMHKGTLPWLESDHVREVCESTMKTNWKEMSEDMIKLRAYAAKVVEKLAVNELMIEPDTNGVGYLTCVQVRDADVPWLVSSVNRA